MAFVKLDTGILDSTLWIDRECREVFITALLLAEPREITEPMPQIEVRSLDHTGFVVPPEWYGFVSAAGVGILRRAMVEEGPGFAALEKLGSVDLESRSKKFDGRRLVRVDGGFLVLNYMEYRDRDHTAAERQRNLRERKRTGIQPLIDAQKGLCACCSGAFEKPYSLYVVQDHNHKNGENRALLCQSCNKLVGLVENGKQIGPPEKRVQVSQYLRRYGVTERNVDVKSRIADADADADADAVKSTKSNPIPAAARPAPPKKAPAKGNDTDPDLPQGAIVWQSYADAYQNRYGVPPVRNKTINSHLKAFAERLGVTEAPMVAAFYLTHNRGLYVSSKHTTALLLRDAEGLRTEWATGTRITDTRARQEDRGANTLDIANELIEEQRRARSQ